MAGRSGGLVSLDKNMMIRTRPENDVETVIHAIKDDNITLKRKLNQQDEQTKKLFTKIQRLTEELKRTKDAGGVSRSAAIGVRPDQETDALIGELRSQVAELQKANSNLKTKAQHFKSLHEADTRIRGPFDHVSPRVNSGMQRRLVPSLVVKSRPPPKRTNLNAAAADAQAMMEEIEKLEDIINMLREKEMGMEHEINEMRAENRLLREAQDNNALRGDIDRVALQRELTEKAKRIREWQTRYDQLEDKFRSVSETHSESIRAMESLNSQLKDERARNSELERSSRQSEVSKRESKELNEIINDLREEKKLLEKEQARLLQNALTAGRADPVEMEAMRKKILQMEKDLGERIKDNSELMSKFQEVGEELKSAREDKKDCNIKMYDTQSRLEQLEERLRWFSKNGEIDLPDLEEALTMIRLKRERGLTLDFLMNLDELHDDKKLLQDLRSQYAECIQELDKCRRLLSLQEEINRDYKNEVEMLNRRMEALKNEYELRLEEDASLLDLRANKLAYVEAQLKSLAHGTTSEHMSHEVETDDDIVLENGQNLVEINVDGALISEAGFSTMRKLGLDFTESSQATFVVHFDFFNFETQVSPLGLGLKPLFNFTSRYKVLTDDYFLRYLKSQTMTMTICRTAGIDYVAVASCNVSFSALTDSCRTSRLQYYADLISLHDAKSIIGKIDYSLRIHLPMDEAIKKFKERTFALNLLQSKDVETTLSKAVIQAAVNHLLIRIFNCTHLVPPPGISPSTFVAFTLYGNQNVVTDTVRNTTNPLFNYVKTLPIPVTHDVDRYLRTNSLELAVLDETDLYTDYVYGTAKIPLLALAGNESIDAEFELKGQHVGDGAKIRISISWEKPFRLDDPKVASLFGARATVAEVTMERPMQGTTSSRVVNSERVVTKAASRAVQQSQGVTEGGLQEPKATTAQTIREERHVEIQQPQSMDMATLEPVARVTSALTELNPVATNEADKTRRMSDQSVDGLNQQNNSQLENALNEQLISSSTLTKKKQNSVRSPPLAPSPALTESLRQNYGHSSIRQPVQPIGRHDPERLPLVTSQNSSSSSLTSISPQPRASVPPQMENTRLSYQRNDSNRSLSTYKVGSKQRLTRQDSEYSTTESLDRASTSVVGTTKPSYLRQSSYDQSRSSIDTDASLRHDFAAGREELFVETPRRFLYGSSNTDDGSRSDTQSLKQVPRSNSNLSSPSASVSEGENIIVRKPPSMSSLCMPTTDDEDDDDDLDDDLERFHRGNHEEDAEGVRVLRLAQQSDEDEPAQDVSEEIHEDDVSEDEQGDNAIRIRNPQIDGILSNRPQVLSQNFTVSSEVLPGPTITAPDDDENGITISINGICFDTDSQEAMNLIKNVKQVFVAFEFLDSSPDELETDSVSVVFNEKRRPQVLQFTYSKYFDLDSKTNSKDRAQLSRFMKSRNPYITFCVVSEPAETETEQDCQDLANAKLDLRDLLQHDLMDVAVPLYAMESDVQLGELMVSIMGQGVVEAICS
ncbi:hypothetical protein SeMB42_g05806 [Synchytrium endobioticum]|uniref:C2 domain-containing protein n=1 Tax=Synchytrium endobioticum TaxID=286115 RepID=A0A507D4E7_9FUNG|nr:hypothetical protein SeMB42_g05806 [Synchytrium endobioticum]TPX46284.1 hypothetical protein SeLEV6574_g03305 [Synchytrium endobioticum]